MKKNILDVKIYNDLPSKKAVFIMRIFFLLLLLLAILIIIFGQKQETRISKEISKDSKLLSFTEFLNSSGMILSRPNLQISKNETTVNEIVSEKPASSTVTLQYQSCKLDAILENQFSEKPSEGFIEEVTSETGQETVEEVTDYSHIYKKIGISEYEFNVLCKYLWNEYGHGCLEGQAATVSVILNRIKSEYFPNDIVSVIGQKDPDQFAEAYCHEPFVEPTETMIEAIEIAFSGTDYSNGAVYYANLEKITNEDTLNWFLSLEVAAEVPYTTFFKLG